MKNFIYLCLFILFPVLVLGQESATEGQVTVLMQNRSKFTGLITQKYLYTIDLRIDSQTYRLKRKDIVAILPNENIIADVEGQVLKDDLIELRKNKIWLSGQIVEIDDKVVHFKVGKSNHFLRLKDIKKIYPKGQEISFLAREEDVDYVEPLELIKLKRKFAKEGFYHIFYGSLATKNTLLEDSFLRKNGLGLQYIFGYQFSNNFGLGLGISYLDYYDPEAEDSPKFIPIFAEARGYFLKKKTSPYYNLAVGIGTGTKFNKNLPSEVTPGLYTHPALGYKIGSDKIAVLFDVGLQFTKVIYEFDLTSNGFFQPNQTQVFDTRRIVLRLGIMF